MADQRWREEYSLEITAPALDFIRQEGNKLEGIPFAVVLVDTHCCGGILGAEVHAMTKLAEDPHLEELFSPSEINDEFSVWVERLAIQESSIPDRILLDFNPFSHPPRLEIKNGRFEEPYEQ